MQQILSKPLVCGFDYTRHESEWATIDKASLAGEVGAAMSRFPAYQGDAAEGYRVGYDVYSVGLVLVEIALWMPLESLLKGKKAAGSDGDGSGGAGEWRGLQLGVPVKAPAVELSAVMKEFYKPHAEELRKRVVARVESELAFRVGSPFCRAVQFCLEFADKRGEVSGTVDVGEVGVHPAMEFYNNVVVPLAALL
jgi:hypothetical protein